MNLQVLRNRKRTQGFVFGCTRRLYLLWIFSLTDGSTQTSNPGTMEITSNFVEVSFTSDESNTYKGILFEYKLGKQTLKLIKKLKNVYRLSKRHN